jgi:hypothetical protein
MDARPNIWAVLVLALAAQLFDQAKAQSFSTYFESSGTQHKPRSNAGVSVQGDRLHMQADLALRAAPIGSQSAAIYQRTADTQVVPNVRSAFTIARNLDIETRVNFAEWNAGTDTTFDTRLHYKKSLGAFFDELDGSFWRTPDGLTKQSLRLGFYQILGDASAMAPLTITGRAIFEATQNAVPTLPGLSGDSHKVGVETRVAGLMSPFLAADNSLSLKIEKTLGMRAGSASTVAYDQAWALSPLTRLGFNLKLLRQTYSLANDVEPSINFTWRSQF